MSGPSLTIDALRPLVVTALLFGHWAAAPSAGAEISPERVAAAEAELKSAWQAWQGLQVQRAEQVKN